MNYDEIHADPNDKPLRINVQNSEEKVQEQPKAKLQETIEINSHASVVKIIVIVTVVLGALMGIISGFTFPSLELSGSYFSDVEESFNIVLMLVIWTGTAVTSVGWLVLYWLLDSIENVLIELKRANHYYKQTTEK